MPGKLRSAVDFHHPRFMQISESHCGPAVIQMLLSNIGVEVTQEDIAEAGGATNLIAMNGMRVDQLGLAVERLAPQALFYYKDHCSIDELIKVVCDYHYPVGVEWQGVFEDEEDLGTAGKTILLAASETEDSDYGHYSLVVRADRRKRELIIADPYKDYFSQARVFSFDVFDRRWYDFNEVPDAVTGQPILLEDERLMFVIVQRNITFPRRIGMQLFTSKK
jgi:hypothetical protein